MLLYPTHNRPASIHCLQAWGALLALIKESPAPERGFLLHSYGGSLEMVDPFAALGAYFSFPGAFARQGKQRQRDLFRSIPPERLLIETDAPDQMPPAHLIQHPLHDTEGQPLNHPANLPAIYAYLADQFQESPATLIQRTKENFQRLFGIP